MRTNAESSGGECRRKSPGGRRRDRRAVSRGRRFPSCEKRCIRRSADHVSRSGPDRGEADGFRSNATRRFWFSDLHASTRNRLRHRRGRGSRESERHAAVHATYSSARSFNRRAISGSPTELAIKSFLRLVRVVFYCPTWQTSTVTKIRSAVTRGALRATAASNLSSRFAVSGSDISAANRLGSELQDVRPLLWRLKSRRRQPSIHMGCGL